MRPGLAAIARLIVQRFAVNGRSFNGDSFISWHVGDVKITKIVEMEGEGFGEFLLPDAAASVLKRVQWLHPGHIGQRGGLKLSIHSFVIETAGKRILVDTNVGNGKKRRIPIWNRLSMPWLQDLRRAGFPEGSIDVVVCSHLHIDHVGWNTSKKNGVWIPTFPNAQYIFVKEELEYWRDRADEPERAEVFKDSIEPILSSGQARLVSADAEVVPGVRLVPTPGHTEHHVAIQIEDRGETAFITGDAFHHPIQIAYPEWSSSFDTSPEVSVRTRHELLATLADKGVLVLGTAFPDPSGGYIVRDGRKFRFHAVN